MNINQNPAAERLFKKLAALRATLPNDERDILDQFITVDGEEVTAHRLSRRVNRRVSKNAPEVTAHKLTKQANRKATKKATKKAAR